MRKNRDPWTGMNIPDHISESLEKVFKNPDPEWEKFGSGIRKNIPDPQY
jgi:hypothetical protein